ncbi:hypothetical protein A5865_000408, partial [Enterococcus sp. 12E11_DIV0728]
NYILLKFSKKVIFHSCLHPNLSIYNSLIH